MHPVVAIPCLSRNHGTGTICLASTDDFSFAMDVEIALPSGNIDDEPDACGNTLEGYTCAAPEYATGKKGGWGGGG